MTHFIKHPVYRISVPVDALLSAGFDRIRASIDFKMRTAQLECEAEVRRFMNQTRLGADQIVLVHFKGKVFPQWRGGALGGVR